VERWDLHCSKLREWKSKDGVEVFNDRCKQCDIEQVVIAEEKKEPLIYLCHGGLVDLILPVVVDDQTIAVLFTGQQRPTEGNIWSKDFIDSFATQDNVVGSEDAWSESVKRNNAIMSEMQALGGDPVPNLLGLAQKAPEIRPKNVQAILKAMQEASNQLSQLAERTIGYELNVIKAYFTSKVAQLLPLSDEEFWLGFSKFLSEFAEFHGFDYAFFYMLRRETDDYMYCFTTIGEKFSDGKPPLVCSSTFFGSHKVENCMILPYKPQDAKRAIFKSKHLFDSPCYIIPMVVNGPLGIIVMGCLERRKPPKPTSSIMNSLREQSQEIAIVIENRRQLQARDMYVTDIAHEIRSPIAAVLATAENIVAGSLDQVRYRAGRVISRLRSLEMAVERFRVLDKLLSDRESLKPAFILIHDVAKECQNEFSQIASERTVRIEIDNDALTQLPRVVANREVFKHALGNLVHNAVKYANPGTTVFVEGRIAGNEIKVDIKDVGIPVPADAIPLLGQRHFRTKEAIKRDPTGTGIGLTLVNLFLKITRGRLEVKSEQLHSGQDYVVVFSMYLPR
jgi:nitrogen-specific signal transduction histidine kinase